MTYKFGEVMYDPSDERCIQMLGKVVAASNTGSMISNNPMSCVIGILKEVASSTTDRPFKVLAISAGQMYDYAFIREILKTEDA